MSVAKVSMNFEAALAVEMHAVVLIAALAKAHPT